MLSVLWAIETARLPLSEDATSNLEIEVVGDVGRDAVTGDIKYSLITYNSVIALTDETKMRPDSLDKESMAYLRSILEMKLKGNPWQEALSNTK